MSFKIGNNIAGKADLDLIPGISMVNLVEVIHHKEYKTKAGNTTPCLELKFVSIPTEKDQETRVLTDRFFPSKRYMNFDSSVEKNLAALLRMAKKVKHIYNAFSVMPEFDVPEDDTAYNVLFAAFAEGLEKVEGYKTQPVWLISCFNGKYQSLPGLAVKNFIEPVVSGKATTLVVDPNLHPLTPEVVGAASGNDGVAGTGLEDLPIF